MRKTLGLIIVLVLTCCGSHKIISLPSMPTVYDDAPMAGFVHRFEKGMRKLSVTFDTVYIANDSIKIEGSVIDCQIKEPIAYSNIAWLKQLSSESYELIRFLGQTDLDGHFNVSLPNKVDDEKLLIGFETPCHMSIIYAL